MLYGLNVERCARCCCSCLQLSSYAAAVDYSAAEAASITNRLDLITKLCRRFRCTRGASVLLNLQEQWSEQLEQFYASEGDLGSGCVGEGGGGGVQGGQLVVGPTGAVV